jgi:hypothetical protein
MVSEASDMFVMKDYVDKILAYGLHVDQNWLYPTDGRIPYASLSLISQCLYQDKSRWPDAVPWCSISIIMDGASPLTYVMLSRFACQ